MRPAAPSSPETPAPGDRGSRRAPPARPASGAAPESPAGRERARHPSPGGDDTRARIVDAALRVLREGGIAGISARSIARHGRFNQALIFYHFGSVEGLLIAVARSESERRSALYAPALAHVTSLGELVAVARRLHEEEFSAGSVAALTQMLAGANRSEELARGVREALAPWTRLVDETIARLLAATPYGDQLPHGDLTSIVTALFLGIELYTGLDPAATPASLFATLESLATLVDALVGTSPA